MKKSTRLKEAGLKRHLRECSMGQTKSSQQNGGSCQRMKEVIQGDNQVRLLLKEIKAEKNEALTSHKLGNSYCPNPLSLLVASSVSLTQKSKNNYFSHSLGLKKPKQKSYAGHFSSTRSCSSSFYSAYRFMGCMHYCMR